MSDLLECLYNFIYTHRVDAYLVDDADYRENMRCSERKWALLMEVLPAQVKQQLEDYRDMRLVAAGIEQEALFRAGLALGLELSRL